MSTELTTTNADKLEADVLLITPDSPDWTVAAVMDRLKAAEERLKQIKGFVTEKVIEWIEANGDLVIGDVRYYVGPKKITKCIDVPGAVAALLIASDGDFGKLCEFFASQPLKYGACKEPLGDQWDQFFRVEEVIDLKEGKPKKA